METDNSPRAVVLLSGGLDSATVLALARADGRRCLALSFRYGQRHADAELAAAAALAGRFGVEEHRTVTLDPAVYALSSSSLLGTGGPVPKVGGVPRRAAAESPPSTYVPARNTLFLAHGLAVAESAGAAEIHIGVNAVDGSGYPDCRPEFAAAFQSLANVATAAGGAIRIIAPLLHWNKAEIIRRGTALGVDYGMTLSCYDPDAGGRACGACEACWLRRNGFAEAGIPDPTRYRRLPADGDGGADFFK